MDIVRTKLIGYLDDPRVQYLPLNPKNKNRTYWSDNYAELMDRDVFDFIVKHFYPYLKHFYPEKVDGLTYT